MVVRLNTGHREQARLNDCPYRMDSRESREFFPAGVAHKIFAMNTFQAAVWFGATPEGVSPVYYSDRGKVVTLI